jgi:hypothetical protein
MSLAIGRSPRTSFGAILQYDDETLPFPSKIIFIFSEFVDMFFLPIRIYNFGNLTMNSEYFIIKSYSVIGHKWSSTTLFI